MTTGVVLSSLRNSRTSEYPDNPVPTITIGAWSVIILLRQSADFDHLEVFFAYTTIRTYPVFRDIFPGRPRRNTVFRPAFGFVVNQATYYTLPLFHNYSRLKFCPPSYLSPRC